MMQTEVKIGERGFVNAEKSTQGRSIFYERDKMKLLKNEEQKPYGNGEIRCICKQKFGNKYGTDKNIVELKIIVIPQVDIDVPHVTYVISNTAYLKKLPYVFAMDPTMMTI